MKGHLDPGTLRAHADGECTGAGGAAVARHLATCARCRQRLEAEVGARDWALRRLARLEAGPDGAPEVEAAIAWRRLQVAAGAVDRPPRPGRSTRPARRRGAGLASRWAAAGGVAVALLGAALALPPVRAAAAQVLALFRVQQVQVITITPAELSQMGAAWPAGAAGAAGAPALPHLQQLVRVTGPAQPPSSAVTAAQAAAALPFPLRAPAQLPPGYSLAGLRLQPATQIQLRLRGTAIDHLLAALGSAPLPAGLAGTPIGVQVPASVVLDYSGPTGGRIHVVEAGDPTLSLPAGADAAALRQLLLRLPFLPAALRGQLAAVSDWQHTALLPAIAGLSQGVRVDGVQGLFVTPPARQGGAATTASPAPSGQGQGPAASGGLQGAGSGETALVWLAGGVVHAVIGPLTLGQGQAIAAALA